jgi:hypothetical protein
MLKRSSSPDAEVLAITALTFLAEDAARLSRFLDMTGINPAEIRALSQSPAFFVAILDHLLADEGLLLAFAANHQLKPEAVAQARRSFAPESPPLYSL